MLSAHKVQFLNNCLHSIGMNYVYVGGCACPSVHMFQVENRSMILIEFVMKAVPVVAISVL